MAPREQQCVVRNDLSVLKQRSCGHGYNQAMRNTVLGLGLCLTFLSLRLASAQVMPVDARNDALQSVIQIVPYNWVTDQFFGWSGSGTVISTSGHVLTNYHVIVDDAGQPLDILPIFVTDSKQPTEAARFAYLAVLLDGDPDLDLALLQILADTQFESLPDDYLFMHAPIGTTENLQFGDAVFVIGFPGVAGNTITYTGGIISGFLGPDLIGSGDAWVKTDARISPGNSGGGAFDAAGTLIGVPTLLLQGTIAGQNQELFRPINYAYDLILQHVPMDLLQVGPRSAQQAPVSRSTVPPSTPTVQPRTAVVRAGVTVESSIDFTDPWYFSDRHAQAFTFEVAQTGRVQIIVESVEFDPYLVVLSPSGHTILDVDDSPGAGFNVTESLQVSDSGTYTAVVTSALPRESGAFLFSVSEIDSVGLVEVSVADVPPGASRDRAPTYTGYWSGRLIDTAGGRGAVTATITQTGNAIVEGSWEATFSWGTTSGTILGLIQSEGLFVELYPDDPTACPFSGLAELSGFTIAGAYTAFDCSVPIAGSLSMTKRE